MWESWRSQRRGVRPVCNLGMGAECPLIARMQHIIFLGFLFASFCSCSAWSPTSMCLFLPFPIPLYCFSLLIALLPIFLLVSYLGFFFLCLFPPAPLSFPYLLCMRFGSTAIALSSELISPAVPLYMQNRLRHICGVHQGQEWPRLSSVCAKANPSALKPTCISKGKAALCWCSGCVWVWARLRLWTRWRIWDTQE